MPKVKGKKARGGGKASARKTREEAGRLRPRGSEAAGRDLGNQAPQPVADGAGQAALASLSLEQLMDAVGLRVRQEINARRRPRTFLIKVWEGVVPQDCRRHLTNRNRGLELCRR